MAELFSSGRVIDIIVVCMLIECAVLIYLRRHSSGLSTGALLTNLAAGAALLLSLRAALVGAPWQIISLWLIAALLAHLAELRIRWSAP